MRIPVSSDTAEPGVLRPGGPAGRRNSARTDRTAEDAR